MTNVSTRPARFSVRGDGQITEIPFYLPRPKRFVASTTVVTDTRK